MSSSLIVREKYILVSSIIFLLRHEISFDTDSALGQIIGYMDHTHLPTSKHHALSKDLFRTDKGSATILMLVISRMGKLLFASGGMAGKSNDRFIVTLTHLSNFVRTSEIIYADDGFFEKNPLFIHTPKFLKSQGQNK